MLLNPLLNSWYDYIHTDNQKSRKKSTHTPPWKQWVTLSTYGDTHKLIPWSYVSVWQGEKALLYLFLTSIHIKMVLHVFETHLKRASLVTEAVENAWAGAKKVVHVSVRAVQTGIKLKSVIYGDGSICVLHTRGKNWWSKIRTQVLDVRQFVFVCVWVWVCTDVGGESTTHELLPFSLLSLACVSSVLEVLQGWLQMLHIILKLLHTPVARWGAKTEWLIASDSTDHRPCITKLRFVNKVPLKEQCCLDNLWKNCKLIVKCKINDVWTSNQLLVNVTSKVPGLR